MPCESDAPAGPRRPISAKFVVSGGFGAGKTTFVGAISEITPLRTEAAMTVESLHVDDTSAVPDKRSTTVAMDFGKISIDTNLVLYLFGTPGQDRFGFMWDDIIRGALGGVVIVDTRRLDDCFPTVDYFERCDVPFVVAVNNFDGVTHHDLEDVREALAIPAGVPLVPCDAREEDSARDVLTALCEHVLARFEARQLQHA